MARAVIALLVAIAGPAHGQAYVPAPALDVSSLPTKADVQTALTNAASAQAAAAAACRAMPAVPPAEMVGGSTGTANTSCRPADAAQPRITRATIVTTDTSGGWAVTWTTPLPLAPVVLPVPVNTTSEPVVCNVAAVSASAASGRCWYARTLPAAITLLSGLVNYDVFGASAAGIKVQILAIPTTQ